MMISKISPSLRKSVRTLSCGKQEIIVYMRSISDFKRLSRYDIVREYPFINAVGINLNIEDLESLSYLPSVEYVMENSGVFTFDDIYTDNTPMELSYKGNLSGKGVKLCVLDTGISQHLDFCLPLNRIIEFKDFVNGEDAPYDDNGHGTFVSGVAAGAGITSGLKYAGVAPSSEIVGVKVIGNGGEGGAFNVLDGMQWLLDNRKKLDVRVCCMSFGSTPVDVNDPLKRGAEVLVKNNIAVVAAAGNSGRNRLKSPAISLDVISVGAVHDDDKVAEFTSRGYIAGRQKPEIYAEGVNVISTVSGASYGRMSGTSVAAPYIAGACCLLLEKYPSASPKRLRDMLLRSSKLNSTGQYILRLE